MNKIDCNGVLTNRSKIGIHQSHTNKRIEILIIFSIDGSITKTPDIIKVVTINIIKMFFWKSILCFGNVKVRLDQVEKYGPHINIIERGFV